MVFYRRMTLVDSSLLLLMVYSRSLVVHASLAPVEPFLGFGVWNCFPCVSPMMDSGWLVSARIMFHPWDLLAELFETAQHDDSTEDIHQRVCNPIHGSYRC
jgi:hypothetical protein